MNEKQLHILEGLLLGTGFLKGGRFFLNQHKSKIEYVNWLLLQLPDLKLYQTKNTLRLYSSTKNIFKSMEKQCQISSLSETHIIHWAIQSGIWHKNSLTLKSSFDLSMLIDLLYKSFSVVGKVQQGLITISDQLWINQILKQITWECCQINIKTLRLGLKKAKDIRKKFQDGSSIKMLAQEYNVSFQTIYNIINKVTYKEKDFAKVNIVYNPY